MGRCLYLEKALLVFRWQGCPINKLTNALAKVFLQEAGALGGLGPLREGTHRGAPLPSQAPAHFPAPASPARDCLPRIPLSSVAEEIL